MESTRDSSVWRNLAVTFSGGLALGAVGMRLTQTALRPAAVTPRPNTNPVAGRLSRLEHLATGQVERRLAGLEARITVELQGLHQQNRHSAEATGKGLADIEQQFRQELADLRTAVQREIGQLEATLSQMAAGQVNAQAELQALRQQGRHIMAETAKSIADARQQWRQEVVELRTAVDTAAAARIEDQVAPLRAEVHKQGLELAELRHRLAESERSVLDVILAIGQICRQAATFVPPPKPVEEAAPQAPAITPGVTGAEGVTLAADPTPAQATPDFLDEADRSRPWRIPLVSSFLLTTGVTTGCLLLTHYL